MYINTCIYIYIYMYTYTYTYIYIYICIYIYMHIYECIYVFVPVRVCVSERWKVLHFPEGVYFKSFSRHVCPPRTRSICVYVSICMHICIHMHIQQFARYSIHYKTAITTELKWAFFNGSKVAPFFPRLFCRALQNSARCSMSYTQNNHKAGFRKEYQREWKEHQF